MLSADFEIACAANGGQEGCNRGNATPELMVFCGLKSNEIDLQ